MMKKTDFNLNPNPVCSLIGFVKYYEESSEISERGVPVVTICSYCKSIKDTYGQWYGWETMVDVLEQNIQFSHSVCPDCYEKVARSKNLL